MLTCFQGPPQNVQLLFVDPRTNTLVGPLYFSLFPIRHKSLILEDMCEVGVGVHARVCAHARTRLMLSVFLYHSPTYILSQDLSLDLALTDLMRLSSC